MDLVAKFQELREWVKGEIQRSVATVAFFAEYSKSSAMGTGDALKGWNEGGGSKYDRESLRLQQIGFRSVPVVGAGRARGIIDGACLDIASRAEIYP